MKINKYQRVENKYNQFALCIKRIKDNVLRAGMKKEAGIDGILVTVGLCIIALLLCVVMKDSLTTFINTIMAELTNEAKALLSGVAS